MQNMYTSRCCGKIATKPSVSLMDGSLGKWNCSGCHRACKVSASPAPKANQKA